MTPSLSIKTCSDPRRDNGCGCPLNDRHSQRMQWQPFDRRFLDPGMAPGTLGEIRQADLILSEPFLQGQPVDHLLLVT